jgi:hypothetical protein
MRIRNNRLPAFALLIVVLALAARMTWRVSRTTIGWETLRDDWAEMVPAPVGFHRQRLADQSLEDQALFWLDEVDRHAATKEDPHVAAGAAWMLDSGQIDFDRHSRHLEALDVAGAAKYDRELDRFEELCHERCAALVDRAVALDPRDVELWRTRALLAFRYNALGSSGMIPRRSDWAAVLDECASHDTENALYDYLAALHDWTVSAKYDYLGMQTSLAVRNEEVYERGMERYAAGLQKPRLMFGDQGFSETLAFLEQSSVSRMDRLYAAESREIANRSFLIPVHDLQNWQLAQFAVARQKEKIDLAIGTIRDIQRVADQFTDEGNPPGSEATRLVLRLFGVSNLIDLADRRPDLFDADQKTAMKDELRDIRLELDVRSEASRRLEMDDLGRRRFGNSLAGCVMIASLQYLAVLLAAAAGIWLLAWIVGRRAPTEAPALGPIPHLMAWSVGLGSSFAVLGLIPAGVVSSDAQIWVIRGLGCLAGLSLASGLLYALSRLVRIEFGRLAAIALTVSVPWLLFWYGRDAAIDTVARLHPLFSIVLSLALFGIAWIAARADLAFVRSAALSGRRKGWVTLTLTVLAMFAVPWIPSAVDFLKTNIEGATRIARLTTRDPHFQFLVEDGAKSQRQAWVRALIQWHLYSGFYAGAAAGLLLFAWFTIRRVRQPDGDIRRILRDEKRAFLRSTGIEVARSLLVAGLCALAIDFAVTPAAVDERERQYHRQYMRLVNPAAAAREIESEVAAIKGDSSIMDKLRQKANQ